MSEIDCGKPGANVYVESTYKLFNHVTTLNIHIPRKGMKEMQ